METRARSANAHTYRTSAAVALLSLALAGLAGCGSDDSDGSAPRATQSTGKASAASAPSAPPTTAPASTPTPTTAADGKDYRACFDGTCEIAVSKPVRIKVDDRYRLTAVEITEITADSVTFQANGSSGLMMMATCGPGGQSTLNDVTITVKRIKKGTAILGFSSGR